MSDYLKNRETVSQSSRNVWNNIHQGNVQESLLYTSGADRVPRSPVVSDKFSSLDYQSHVKTRKINDSHLVFSFV